jgi:hypothetical protein
MVAGFSIIGRKTRCPLCDAFHGKYVSWGIGVITTCKLLSVLLSCTTGALSAALGFAVGAALLVLAAGLAAGSDLVGAVESEPHATRNIKSIEISTTGFLRTESFITSPPNIGTTY